MERISRIEYAMLSAELAAKRSTCLKLKVGAVATIDNRIIASGYNGVLSGFEPTTGLDEDGEYL